MRLHFYKRIYRMALFAAGIILMPACGDHPPPAQNNSIPPEDLPVNLPQWYNMQDVPAMMDNDAPNPNVQYNNIYRAGRVFTYRYLFADSSGKRLLTAAYYDERCMQDPSILCVNWTFTDAEHISYAHNFPVEYVKMRVCSTMAHNPIAQSQTVLKIDYYNRLGRILVGEQNGVQELPNQVMLYMPRLFGFALNECNPFPMIRMGDEFWSSEMDIPPVLLAGAKIYVPDQVAFNIMYQNIGVQELDLGGSIGKVRCAVTQSDANSPIGATSLRSYFNDKYGFVRLEFNNINHTRLVMELMDATP
ncbi:MAG: hypothetical protein H6585_14755 [Flavobacteriales bacterium]|nr:hypothetical protein [Flavobacteriales bacterium]MCB9449590.1 hypothetical protein [Flavobacteriales bacterium]